MGANMLTRSAQAHQRRYFHLTNVWETFDESIAACMPGAKGLSGRGCIEDSGIYTQSNLIKERHAPISGWHFCVDSLCPEEESRDCLKWIKGASLQRGKESTKGRIEEGKWLETSADNLILQPKWQTSMFPSPCSKCQQCSFSVSAVL